MIDRGRREGSFLHWAFLVGTLVLSLINLKPAWAFDPQGDPCDRFKPQTAQDLPVEDQLSADEKQDLFDDVDGILAEMGRMRGLAVRGTIRKAFKDQMWFSDYFLKASYREVPQEKGDGFSGFYTWLGLLDPGVDWRGEGAKSLARDILGLYVPEDKTLYLADWITPDKIRPVLVHELVHALQDQAFDLTAMDQKILHSTRDESAALAALREGEAVLLSWQYLAAAEPDGLQGRFKDFGAYLHELETVENGRRRAWGCPERFSRYLNFSYTQGPLFVQSWVQKDGWKALDRWWKYPPRSTRQVLQPFQKLAPPEALEFHGMEKGPLRGGTLLWEERFGANGYFMALAPVVGTSAALLAVAGWTGDRMEFWGNPSEGWKTLVGCASFEDETSSGRFAAAFRAWQASRRRRGRILQDDEKVQWFKGPGETASYFVERDGRKVYWIEGLDVLKTREVRKWLIL